MTFAIEIWLRNKFYWGICTGTQSTTTSLLSDVQVFQIIWTNDQSSWYFIYAFPFIKVSQRGQPDYSSIWVHDSYTPKLSLVNYFICLSIAPFPGLISKDRHINLVRSINNPETIYSDFTH